MNTQIDNVITNLNTLAPGIDTQDADFIVNFYNFLYNGLKTDEEREAFKLGSLAVFAEAGKFRIRSVYYTFLFKRAVKRLKEADA